MRAFFAFVLTVLGIAAIVLYSSAFIVHQNEQALVLRFGNPQQVITTPGLKWLGDVEYSVRPRGSMSFSG